MAASALSDDRRASGARQDYPELPSRWSRPRSGPRSGCLSIEFTKELLLGRVAATSRIAGMRSNRAASRRQG